MIFPVLKCVNCGFCCSKMPCGYGEKKENSTGCKYLTEKNLCEKFEEISKDKNSYISPAFGKGCCQPLGNELRRNIIIDKYKGESQVIRFVEYIDNGKNGMLVKIYGKDKKYIETVTDSEYWHY